MQTVLIVVHLMVVVALVIVVLLQRSEGGALGIGSSSSGGLFTGRGQANALTRATAILAAMFFVTSIGLTVMATYGRAPKSIFQSAPATPAGSLTDDLKKLQDNVPANAPAQTGPEAPRSR
jgi:preprotein translocase subunit SecG